MGGSGSFWTVVGTGARGRMDVAGGASAPELGPMDGASDAARRGCRGLGWSGRRHVSAFLSRGEGASSSAKCVTNAAFGAFRAAAGGALGRQGRRALWKAGTMRRLLASVLARRRRCRGRSGAADGLTSLLGRRP